MICQWILKAAVVRQRLETQLKEGMYACVYIYIYRVLESVRAICQGSFFSTSGS